MFDKLISVFRSSATDAVEKDPADARRLAVAVLLVEAARADENYTDPEKTIIEKTLIDLFKVDPEQAVKLRTEAEAVQAAAVDLHSSTKIAKALSIDDKTRLIEALWTVILSDGERDAYEDALVRRICGLIHFSDRESGEARQRAAGKAG